MKRNAQMALSWLALAATMNALAQPAVDEAAIRHTLYVNAALAQASDRNTGTEPTQPLRSLQKAVQLAGNQPTRIRIYPGVYREFVNIDAGTNVLVLEATEPGKAILSGAEPVTGWRDEGHGIGSFEWTNQWGLNLNQFYFPGQRTKLNQRREMVFIENQRLVQRCQEDEKGSAIAPASLRPGEFTVDETARRIVFRAPAGLDLTPGRRIEVSVRGYNPGPYPNDGKSLLVVKDRANLVLRGLRVERVCNYILANPAVSLSAEGGKDPAGWLGNILLDRCEFADNNGVGLGLNTLRGVTLRGCKFRYNGERGGGAGNIQDLLVEDCEFTGNGWRFGPWLVGHDMGGFKLFDGADTDGWFKHRSCGVRFVRCAFRQNLCHNIWQDFGPVGTVIDTCLFEESPNTAIMQEVTPGSLLATNCVIRRCGTAGDAAVLIVASPNITFSHCLIYDCGNPSEQHSSIFNLIGDKRTVSPQMENAVKDMRLEHCVVQANRTNTFLFRSGAWNDALEARKDFTETVLAEDNTYFGADRPKEGLGEYQKGTNSFFQNTLHKEGWRNSYPDLSFTEWQKATFNVHGPQDQHSRWEELSLPELDRRAKAVVNQVPKAE